MEFRRLRHDICWRVPYLFLENKIVFGLTAGLKIVRLQSFSRICFKDSHKAVVHGKITLEITSENPLCCFFLFWIIHFGVTIQD